MDFYHIWHRCSGWRVDEPIRFWARSARGQRSKVNELGLKLLFLPVTSSKNVKWCWTLVGIFLLRWRDERSKVNVLGPKMLKALSRNVLICIQVNIMPPGTLRIRGIKKRVNTILNCDKFRFNYCISVPEFMDLQGFLRHYSSSLNSYNVNLAFKFAYCLSQIITKVKGLYKVPFLCFLTLLCQNLSKSKLFHQSQRIRLDQICRWI